MKKTYPALLVMAASLILLPLEGRGDCGKKLPGTWVIDLGGITATAEYRNNGTLVQKMPGLTLTGTYTVKGGSFTTVVQGRTTIFTILSCDGNTLKIKREMDGKILVYRKK